MQVNCDNFHWIMVTHRKANGPARRRRIARHHPRRLVATRHVVQAQKTVRPRRDDAGAVWDKYYLLSEENKEAKNDDILVLYPAERLQDFETRDSRHSTLAFKISHSRPCSYNRARHQRYVLRMHCFAFPSPKIETGCE